MYERVTCWKHAHSWILHSHYTHKHTHMHTHSLNHPLLSYNSGLQQFRHRTLCRITRWLENVIHLTKRCYFSCSAHLSKTWSHFLPPCPVSSFRKEEGGKKTNRTNALKWKIWSFHLPPLLFARLLLQSWSAEEQMFSQTWRRGASVLMGMALPSSHCWCIDMTAAWFHGAAKKPLVVSVNWNGTVSLSFPPLLQLSILSVICADLLEYVCVHVCVCAAAEHTNQQEVLIYLCSVFSRNLGEWARAKVEKREQICQSLFAMLLWNESTLCYLKHTQIRDVSPCQAK